MMLYEHERPIGIHRRILALGFLGWLGVFTALMLFMALAPRYRTTLDLDDDGVKWVKSLAIGATALGGAFFGLLGDRTGRRRAMRLSLITAAAGLALAGVATTGAVLLVAAVVAGFGIGGQWASGQTLVGETVPPPVRARFGTIAQSGAPIGLILSTAAAWILVPELGWRAVFLGVAALLALLAGALRVIPESDLWLDQRRRLASGERIERPRFRGLLVPGLRGRFAAAFLVTLFCMANYWFTVTWLREFMARQWGLDNAASEKWFFSFAAGSLVGYALFERASALLGLRPAFTVFSLLMAGGTSMLTIFEGAIRGEPGLVLLFAGVAGVGTGVWSSFGPLYAEIFPTRLRATAGGVCMNVSRGAQFLAPQLVLLVGGERLSDGVALAGGFALCAGAAIWLLPATTRRALA